MNEINLLRPAKVTEAGYRLYDEDSLKKLRQIMFLREMDVSLSDIKVFMKGSESDNRKILEIQKMMLELKRNRLNGIIELISDVLEGEDKMSFEAFNEDDVQKIIFMETVRENFQDEKMCEKIIKIYGSKEKAVEASLHSTGDSEEIAEQRNTIDLIYKKFACAKKKSDDGMAMEAVKELGESYKTLFTKWITQGHCCWKPLKIIWTILSWKKRQTNSTEKGLQDISVRLFPGIMVKKF